MPKFFNKLSNPINATVILSIDPFDIATFITDSAVRREISC